MKKIWQTISVLFATSFGFEIKEDNVTPHGLLLSEEEAERIKSATEKSATDLQNLKEEISSLNTSIENYKTKISGLETENHRLQNDNELLKNIPQPAAATRIVVTGEGANTDMKEEKVFYSAGRALARLNKKEYANRYIGNGFNQAGGGAFTPSTLDPDSVDLDMLRNDLGTEARDNSETIWENVYRGFLDDTTFGGLRDRFQLVFDVPSKLGLMGRQSTPITHQHVPSERGSANPTLDALTMFGRELVMRKFEADLIFSDDHLTQEYVMWLSYLRDAELRFGVNAPEKTLNFAMWLFEGIIMKQMNEDLRNAAYKGVYDPMPPRDVLKIVDGVDKIVSDAITSGQIPPVALSPFTVSNVQTQLATVIRTLDFSYRNSNELVVTTSPEIVEMLGDSIQSALVAATGTAAGANMYKLAAHPNAIIVGEPSWSGTQQVLAYKKQDFIMGLYSDNNSKWEVQRNQRQTLIMTNGKIGLQHRAINPDINRKNVAFGEV